MWRWEWAGEITRVSWRLELGFQAGEKEGRFAGYWRLYKVKVSRRRGRFLSQFGGVIELRG